MPDGSCAYLCKNWDKAEVETDKWIEPWKKEGGCPHLFLLGAKDFTTSVDFSVHIWGIEIKETCSSGVKASKRLQVLVYSEFLSGLY